MVLATGLGLLAIFALFAILMDPSDGRDRTRDPRDDASLWTYIGRR